MMAYRPKQNKEESEASISFAVEKADISGDERYKLTVLYYLLLPYFTYYDLILLIFL